MTETRQIRIEANGERYERPAGEPLPTFLEAQGLALERVVVERNGEALTKAEARAAKLAEGDRLEIVRIVAGG